MFAYKNNKSIMVKFTVDSNQSEIKVYPFRIDIYIYIYIFGNGYFIQSKWKIINLNL